MMGRHGKRNDRIAPSLGADSASASATIQAYRFCAIGAAHVRFRA
jgi:hypothetical protein